MALCALTLVTSMPSMALFVFKASSTMAGLVAACAFVTIAGLLGFYKMVGGQYWTISLSAVVAVVLIITVHSLIASLMVEGDFFRAVGSLAATTVIMISAYLFRLILLQTTSRSLDRVMMVISGAFVVVGIMSIIGVQPLSSAYGKPIFPFTEPSHYALSFTPFIIYQSVRLQSLARLCWLATALLLALLLQSLSLVVGVGLAAACCLPISIFALTLISASAMIGYIDVSYFTDRLDFSINTTNVSTLVYIQGFELIGAALEKTGGWGIGFQQLGIVPLNVPTSDLIYSLMRNDANLHDGGFTAAKLISEFGYIGIILFISYVWILVKSVLCLRKMSSKRQGTAHEIFALSVIAGLSIEMFVRGSGYFSGTMLLMGVAVMMAAEGKYLQYRRLAAGRF